MPWCYRALNVETATSPWTQPSRPSDLFPPLNYTIHPIHISHIATKSDSKTHQCVNLMSCSQSPGLNASVDLHSVFAKRTAMLRRPFESVRVVDRKYGWPSEGRPNWQCLLPLQQSVREIGTACGCQLPLGFADSTNRTLNSKTCSNRVLM